MGNGAPRGNAPRGVPTARGAAEVVERPGRLR